MKAWVLHDIGDIRYEEVPVPEPAAGFNNLILIGNFCLIWLFTGILSEIFDLT